MVYFKNSNSEIELFMIDGSIDSSSSIWDKILLAALVVQLQITQIVILNHLKFISQLIFLLRVKY